MRESAGKGDEVKEKNIRSDFDECMVAIVKIILEEEGILEEVEKIAAAGPWLPLKNAPRDGTRFLAGWLKCDKWLSIRQCHYYGNDLWNDDGFIDLTPFNYYATLNKPEVL